MDPAQPPTLDSTKRLRTLKILARIFLFVNGMMSPNTDRLDSKLARMLCRPEFRGMGICLRDLRALYLELCREELAQDYLPKRSE